MGIYARSVARAASRIDDPVQRLRFLQATATHPLRARLGLLLVVFAAALFLAIVAASIRRAHASAPAMKPAAPAARKPPTPAPALETRSPEPVHDVWLVEKNPDSETWSNGLRVDNRFLVRTHARSWLAYPGDGSHPLRRADPAGVVFHTTESEQVPFEAGENRELRQIGESLLDHVRRLRSYNFLIDRFGRVYRVVGEDQVANHAGHSVWADQHWFYVNLNASFLGVSFEAVSPDAKEDAGISPAQIHSAAMLVEMLRQRYRLPASNYVTHAQVSVNPSNMRVGWHVDWASGFPFSQIGLADNYALPLPAVWAYGFDCDAHFTEKAAAPLRAGIEDAEEIVAQRAAAEGLSPDAYRKRLRQRYQRMLAGK